MDGKQQDILKVNDAFMAIPLPAGEYEILFKYRTPYLIPGLLVTCISLWIVYGSHLIKGERVERTFKKIKRGFERKEEKCRQSYIL